MMKYRLACTLALLAPSAFAQDICTGFDRTLSQSLLALREAAKENPPTEAFANIHEGLVNEIGTFAKTQNEAAWQCTFPDTHANHAFNAPVSPDGKLRVWSWDMQTGGTMRHYFTLLQYRDAQGNTHIRPLAPVDTQNPHQGNGGFVTDLKQTDLGGKGTAYWISEYYQGDSLNHGQSITLYRIDGQTLAQAPWITTPDGQTAQIDFAYEADTLLEAGTDGILHKKALFTYDEAQKTLSFPVIRNTAQHPGGEITARTLRYRFDGENFVHTK